MKQNQNQTHAIEEQRPVVAISLDNKSNLVHHSSEVRTSKDPICYNGKFAENHHKGNMGFSRRSRSANSTETHKSATDSKDRSGVIRSRSSSSAGTGKELTEKFTDSSTSGSTDPTPYQQRKVIRPNLKRPCSSSTDNNSHQEPSPAKEAKISKPSVVKLKRKSRFKVIDYSSATRKIGEDDNTRNSLPTRSSKNNSFRGTTISQVDAAPSTSATKFQSFSQDYSNSSQVQKCSTCNAYFLDVNKLVDHSCYPSVCTLCALKFMTKSELNEHNEKVHHRIKKSPARGSLPAPCNTSPQTPTQDEPLNTMELQCFLPKQKSRNTSKTRVNEPSKVTPAPSNHFMPATLSKAMKVLKRFEPKGRFGLVIGGESRYCCVRCHHFFINSKQFSVHYNKCKHPYKGSDSVDDENFRWLCLQCHVPFQSRSDVQKHGKIACSTSNNSKATFFRMSASGTSSKKELNKTKLLKQTPSNRQSTINATSAKANVRRTRVLRTTAVNAKAMNAQKNEKVYCPKCGKLLKLNCQSLSHHSCTKRRLFMNSCVVRLENVDPAIIDKLKKRKTLQYMEKMQAIKKMQAVKKMQEAVKYKMCTKGPGKCYEYKNHESLEEQLMQEVFRDKSLKYSPVSITYAFKTKLRDLAFTSLSTYFCHCAKIFTKLGDFLNHAKTEHKHELHNDSDIAQCYFCFRIFFDDASLDLHTCVAQPGNGEPWETEETDNLKPLLTLSDRNHVVLPLERAPADIQINWGIADAHTISHPQLSASTTSQINVDHSTTSGTDHQNGAASVAYCAPLSSAIQEPSFQHENSSEHCSTSKSNSGTLSGSPSATTSDNSKEVPTSSKKTLCQLDLKHILPDLLWDGSSSKLFVPRNDIEKQLRAAGVNPKPSIIKQFIETRVQDKVTKDAVGVPPETLENMTDLPSEASKDTLDKLLEILEDHDQTQNCNLSSEERLEFGKFEFPDAWHVKDTGNIDSASEDWGKPAERYVCAKCYLTCVNKDALSSHFIDIHDLSMDGHVKVQVFNNHM